MVYGGGEACVGCGWVGEGKCGEVGDGWRKGSGEDYGVDILRGHEILACDLAGGI